MKSVLYQLYDGRLCPHADQRPRIKEHKLLLEKQSLQYEYLANELGKINPALKDNFHAMMESLADQIFWDTSEVFIGGEAHTRSLPHGIQQQRRLKNLFPWHCLAHFPPKIHMLEMY